MIQKQKGTKDILQTETYKWQLIEGKIENILKNYGYKEIRTPVFEATELYQRGVGDTSDVVQKEMYTFLDKGDRSITLRPEGTAGVVRAYIENGMASLPSPIKLWYNMAMYRYENVQKGRLREFHQIGVECFNTDSYRADFELINLASHILNELNIKDYELNINSIGCPNCRKKYEEELKKYIEKNIGGYCNVCKERFNKNPLRILDCKDEGCKKINQNAPSILDYLCDDCKEHFEGLKNLLDLSSISYIVNPKIVRGLDYYSKTVFEFVSKEEHLAIIAGGRYDYLVEELSGSHTPALGYAIGLERLIEMYDKCNDIPEEVHPTIYLASIGEEGYKKCLEIASSLRKNNIFAEIDISGRSLNGEFKYANKIKAKYTLTIGEDEIKKGMASIKCMTDGSELLTKLEIDEIIKNIIE